MFIERGSTSTDAPQDGTGNAVVRWWKGLTDKGRRVVLGAVVIGVSIVGIGVLANRPDPEIERCAENAYRAAYEKSSGPVGQDSDLMTDTCATIKELSEKER